jgi:hypothetical protein
LQHNTALHSLTYGSFTKESPKEFATWFPEPEPDPLYVVNPPGATKRIGEEWRGRESRGGERERERVERGRERKREREWRGGERERERKCVGMGWLEEEKRRRRDTDCEILTLT